jgi:hypothetical protein
MPGRGSGFARRCVRDFASLAMGDLGRSTLLFETTPAFEFRDIYRG